MGRRALYSDEEILSAARGLISSGGPSAATISAIGAALGGAPSGSVYHRFASRHELLGRVWLRTAAVFQNAFVAAASSAPGDAERAGLNAALSLPQQVRADPVGARIMLLHRREDFFSDEWPPEMQAEARRLGRQVDETLTDLARRLLGDGREARRAATFAVLDIPFAAVRPHVAASEDPPPFLDVLIAAAYRSVIKRFRDDPPLSDSRRAPSRHAATRRKG